MNRIKVPQLEAHEAYGPEGVHPKDQKFFFSGVTFFLQASKYEGPVWHHILETFP
jgi:hypothetical protein